MVPFPRTLSDPYPRFQGHQSYYALDVLYVQLTRDLFAIATFFEGTNFHGVPSLTNNTAKTSFGVDLVKIRRAVAEQSRQKKIEDIQNGQ